MTSVIINSVDRALDILNYLYEQGKEVSITQISKDLDIYKSTVYRTLATLERKESGNRKVWPWYEAFCHRQQHR